MDENKDRSTVSSVFLGYLVALLHLLLAIGVVLAVVFFDWVRANALWIALGTLGVLLVSAFIFWRWIKRRSRQIGDILNDPIVRDRAVEVSFLGGMASLRLGAPGSDPASGARQIGGQAPQQLEDPETARMRELGNLVKMREDNLITQDEFEHLKKRLLNRGKPRDKAEEADIVL